MEKEKKKRIVENSFLFIIFKPFNFHFSFARLRRYPRRVSLLQTAPLFPNLRRLDLHIYERYLDWPKSVKRPTLNLSIKNEPTEEGRRLSNGKRKLND